MGSPVDFGSPWDKSREQMHHDMSAFCLTQLSVSGTKPMRTSGKKRKLAGLIHLLEKMVVGIGSSALKMCAKYVPCLQVQFATESLISTPQQPGKILIDKTCWFWPRLQSACFTIHSTVIFKLLAKFTAECFGSEWNLTTTKKSHHQNDAFLRKMGGRSSARTLWPIAVAAFPLLSLSLRRKWGYLGEKETKQTVQQLIKETLN